MRACIGELLRAFSIHNLNARGGAMNSQFQVGFQKPPLYFKRKLRLVYLSLPETKILLYMTLFYEILDLRTFVGIMRNFFTPRFALYAASLSRE